MKRLVVERDLIRNNIAAVKKLADGKIIYGVLKGNGYGLGLMEMAEILRSEGIPAFAVTEPDDAYRLRDSGYIDEDILVMRSTAIDEEAAKIVACNATATIGSNEAAVALNGIAGRQGNITNAHIKIDTGMGRYGFLPSEIDKIISIYKYMPNINITGTYTHFNRSYGSKKTVDNQLKLFLQVVGEIKAAGFDPGLLHAANSSAILKYPDTYLGAVRAGSVFLGRVGVKGDFGLKKVGYAEEQIVEIRWLTRGCTVGYGAKYRCRRMKRIGVVPFGYANGLGTGKAREIRDLGDFLGSIGSNFGRLLGRHRYTALIKGKRVPVLGRVGTLHVVLDLTDSDASIGDYARFEVNPVIAGGMLPKMYV